MNMKLGFTKNMCYRAVQFYVAVVQNCSLFDQCGLVKCLKSMFLLKIVTTFCNYMTKKFFNSIFRTF